MSAEALCYGDLTGVEPLVIADRGAAALMDCRQALGLWAVSEAMDRAVSRPPRRRVGVDARLEDRHLSTSAGP
jgi:hypothetical protein